MLYAVCYNADPALSKTFAIADIYANLNGGSYTRDVIDCAWNAKLSANNGSVTVTFQN